MSVSKRIAIQILVGPSSVAPDYRIDHNGSLYRIVHIETLCWSYADSLRQARRASWKMYALDRPWRVVEANAHAQDAAMPSPTTDARVDGLLAPVVGTIRTEIETWEQHARMEDSPLGGNVVKAAHYHGTAAGLRMAEAMIHEHLSNTHGDGSAASADTVRRGVGAGKGEA